MYGGSGKLGRGRGGGPVKRNIHSTFQPPSVQRPSTTPGGGRLSTGGGHRNRNNTPAATATVSTHDETFSLVRNHPLNFGMIIRLSPVLVDEIKRLEAQGGAARIKFDSSANNPAGNVIDVGGKEFRFTWSQETGDLCDIYEERRTGENGDGLLVESGGAWRKLNVQRELDESVKNHVKMRTVEAERKHKSRKAIVLDHGNPSMRNQMRDAEVNNTWRGSYKQKKDPPFKKIKSGPSSAVIPTKSGGKVGLLSSTPSKIRAPASPLLSTTPEQSGPPLSPLKNSIKATKVHAHREDVTLTQSSKENASISEKEMPSRVLAGVVLNKPGSNERFEKKPTDLQSLLISLLMEKPQGMNLKGLEKAIGETIPNSVKQIEPVLKKIADLKASGRYILKPDVDLESFKKALPENGRSPENNNRHREAPESGFSSKVDMKEYDDQSHMISKPYEEINNSENIDIEHHSPDLLSEKKTSDNNEGHAASSSLSGSDSDSESDSSDSGSESRSRSPSPVGSGSGSSSDSESDASSNSKQGSDEDVDIMSDDDKEPEQKLQQSDPGLSTPPVPSMAPEVGYAPNIIDEKDDGHVSDLVELEKDLFGDNQEDDMHVTTDSFPDKDGDNYADETTNLFFHHLDNQVSEFHAKKIHSDKENANKDDVQRVKSKTKSKRGSDEKHFDNNPLPKRSKPETWSRPSMGRNSFPESPLSRSPERPSEAPYKGTNNQLMSRTVRDVFGYDYEKFDNREFLGNFTSDSPRSGPRSIDLNKHAKAPSMERTDRHAEGLDLDMVKNLERGLQGNKEIREEDGHSKDRRPPKNSRMGGDGGKHSGPHQKKHGAVIGKINESGLVSMPQLKDSPIDSYRTAVKKSPVINGHGGGPALRRELSDLEMGELRENLNEEAFGAKKFLERNNSFKQAENKPSSDYWNLDASKTAKASPPQSGIGMSSYLQSLPKKIVSDDQVDDFTRFNGKPIQREAQSLTRVDHAKAGSQHHKIVKENSKGRHNDTGASQGISSEGYTDSQRKVPVGVSQKHEKQVVALTTRDNRRHKSNKLGEKKKDSSLLDSRDNGQKREMESCSDDSITSYAKYEKEEPEMRGPINDLSQYNEYVQEYREKYDCYCTLNKILESYRNEFQTFERDLELAKGRDNDRYNKVLEQLMESYRQCGSKHKRLKKIFVVLHHELQHLKEMIRDFADNQTKR